MELHLHFHQPHSLTLFPSLHQPYFLPFLLDFLEQVLAAWYHLLAVVRPFLLEKVDPFLLMDFESVIGSLTSAITRVVVCS